MNIYEKLAAVQQELKAPKDKKNTFAGYNYRSAEGILEAVKPVLVKHNATIVLSDDIVEIGGRVYVKATASFFSTEENAVIDRATFTTAFAREAETKKGLDDSQITGVASSYARKYALNGLLLIDDTKDADTDEYQKTVREQSGEKAEEKVPQKVADKVTDKVTDKEYASDAHIKTIRILAEKAGVDISKAVKKPLEELTKDEAAKLIIALKKKAGE